MSITDLSAAERATLRNHCWIPMGPVSGMHYVARELLAHLGYDPDEYPEILAQMTEEIGEETLSLGERILAEHGLDRRTEPFS